jgi:hypothetical protein
MEEKKVTLEKILQRIDQVLNILEMIVGDLNEISNSLKAISGQSTTPSPVAPARPERMRTIDEIKMLFPEELGNMLVFEEKNHNIIIKPRQYLGHENFAKVASIVRSAGGEYISAGKESHFRIQKEARQVG